MKMRKLLPLLLLAIGAILALSSCDALLDAIYPNNSITPTVYVKATNHPTYPTSTVQVTLGGGATPITLEAGWSGYFVVSGATYAVFYLPTFARLNSTGFTLTTQYFGSISPGAFYYTNIFYDPDGFPVTSISMPFNGSKDANVAIYLD